MNTETTGYQRPPGHSATFWAHFIIILALPYFIFVLFYVVWDLHISILGKYANVLLSGVALAPLISYIIYYIQRGKPEEDREREWPCFQTLQAFYYQLVMLVLAFLLPWPRRFVHEGTTYDLRWDVYDIPFGYIKDLDLALVIAMILYGIIGAFAILRGKDDFVYPGIGRLARWVTQGRYVRREQDKKRQADKAQKAKK